MRRWLTFSVLVLIFTLPGFLAVLYFKHPDWLRHLATTNQGDWVRQGWEYPPIADSGKTWTMVVFTPKICDLACEKLLDKTLRVRTALGRHWYDIGVTVLSLDEKLPQDPALKSVLKTERVDWFVLKPSSWVGQAPPSDEAVFLADKQGRFILRYAPGFKPAQLFADSKRLLSVGQSSQ